MLTALLFSIITLIGVQPTSTDTLSLDDIHTQIEANYPLAQKIDLQKDITELNKKIAGTAAYPQFNFGTTATYQSEVTELSFPSGGQFSAPELSKDQYKATVEASQVIYNSGAVGIRKELEEIRGQGKNKVTEVELRQIKEQVNQVYFGILLAQEQLHIINMLMKNIEAQIKEVSSKVDHGVLLPSQKYTLEAELINARQDSAEIRSNISSGYQMLSDLIGEEINPNTKLQMPRVNLPQAGELPRQRPEFELFENNREVLGYRKELAQTDKWPTLSAFGSATYGRPGYNVFADEFHAFYMVGLQLQWNFWNAQNAAKKQQVYQLKQKAITKEERAFERQLKASLSKIRRQIELFEVKLEQDQQIIELREKVVDEKASQMKNGSVTATEYIIELNKVTQARMSQMIHRTKLSQSKINYQTTLGISEHRQ
ncbi:TolC family protein [Fodinibius sp. AD559]|uniref:TolC family protein n=1 Tax=Fodinibius sp. AD559 TaxID=3424179 RepID=UPI004046CC48